MIDKFYKSFKIRDYMDDNVLKNQSSCDLLDCSLGTNAFIDNNFINEFILKSNYEINKYPIIEYELLKQELLKYWNNYSQYKLTINNISFGSGVMGLLRNISEFLINEHVQILGCAPQFPRFVSEVELKKGLYDYYSLDKNNNFKFDINAFLSKTSNKYDLIHIENPNNPTGQIIKFEYIEEIVKKAKDYNSIVIVDEAYGDYMSANNSAITLVGKYNNLVVLRSASKFFGLPNHRIGYLFASEEFIKIYDKISIPFPFSDLSANVFRNILKNSNKLDYTKQLVIDINKKIYENLNNSSYLYTNLETPIFTVKSNKYENLSAELEKHGLLTENCRTYLNLNNKYARIRISKDCERLLDILIKSL